VEEVLCVDSGKRTDRLCGATGVANMPPVTAWSGMPSPVITRVVLVQVQLELLVAFTFWLELGVRREHWQGTPLSSTPPPASAKAPRSAAARTALRQRRWIQSAGDSASERDEEPAGRDGRSLETRSVSARP
jgi:hypothetical protein